MCGCWFWGNRSEIFGGGLVACTFWEEVSGRRQSTFDISRARGERLWWAWNFDEPRRFRTDLGEGSGCAE
jgi:hypothetical protein